MIEKLKLNSESGLEKIKNEIAKLLPGAIKEGKINVAFLQELFDNDIDVEQKFGLSWNGKNDVFKTIQTSTNNTLKPVFDKSINWDNTENLLIEGDNLEVLKLLQKSYYNSIKCIYIDPPYNTGKDFVYKDDFSDSYKNYLKITEQSIDNIMQTTNSESNGRFHSDWLSMMYSRLFLARNLLSKDGFIFISIDDSELFNLKLICDEIFGEENFIANVVRRRRKSQANLAQNIATIHEYILIYSKNQSSVLNKIAGNINESDYKNHDNDPRGPYTTMPCTNKGGAVYSVTTPTGRIIEEEWRFKRETYDKLESENKIIFPRGGEGKPRYKLFLEERKNIGVIPNSWWDNVSSNQEASDELKKLFNDKAVFDYPKPVDLIKLIIELATNDNDIILDFFAGSGSTAQAVLDINKERNKNLKFILVQLPERTDEKSVAYKENYKSISEITLARISKIIKKNNLTDGVRLYRLSDSNFNIWDGDIENYDLSNQLERALNHINSNSTESDILTEVLLKSGFQLTVSIKEIKVSNKKVFSIADGALIVCLDKELTVELIKEIAKLEPARVICLDSGFQEKDDLKTNAIQIMKSHGVDDFRTV
jgi:adenine-specific DNA-methyltransferase